MLHKLSLTSDFCEDVPLLHVLIETFPGALSPIISQMFESF